MNVGKSDYERLVQIHHEMNELLEEAKSILRDIGGIEYQRAKSYWLAHIDTALNNETSYLGGSVITMEHTLDALNPEDDYLIEDSDGEDDE